MEYNDNDHNMNSNFDDQMKEKEGEVDALVTDLQGVEMDNVHVASALTQGNTTVGSRRGSKSSSQVDQQNSGTENSAGFETVNDGSSSSSGVELAAGTLEEGNSELNDAGRTHSRGGGSRGLQGDGAAVAAGDQEAGEGGGGGGGGRRRRGGQGGRGGRRTGGGGEAAEGGGGGAAAAAALPGGHALKLLVPKALAGGLIGAGGGRVAEVQAKSGARVHLSAVGSTFPGTGDRVALVSGRSPAQVKAAAALLVAAYRAALLQAAAARGGPGQGAPPPPPPPAARAAAAAAADPGTGGGRLALRLLVPATAAGLLIGRGGSAIQEMSDLSGTHIQLQAKETSLIPSERILNVTGEFEASVCAAIHLIIDKLSEGPNVGRYQVTSVNYRRSHTRSHAENQQKHSQQGAFSITEGNRPTAAAESHVPAAPAYGGGGGGGGGSSAAAAAAPAPPALAAAAAPMLPDGAATLGRSPLVPMGVGAAGAATSALQVPLPDSVIGAIVGKGGATLAQLQRMSGAKINVSSKGEFVPGTQNRLVTITGTTYQTQLAQCLISREIELSMSGEGRRHNSNAPSTRK